MVPLLLFGIHYTLSGFKGGHHQFFIQIKEANIRARSSFSFYGKITSKLVMQKVLMIMLLRKVFFLSSNESFYLKKRNLKI